MKNYKDFERRLNKIELELDEIQDVQVKKLFKLAVEMRRYIKKTESQLNRVYKYNEKLERQLMKIYHKSMMETGQQPDLADYLLNFRD